MRHTGQPPGLTWRGISVRGLGIDDPDTAARAVLDALDAPDLLPHVQAHAGRDAQGSYLNLQLNAPWRARHSPDLDTLQLAQRLQLQPHAQPQHLVREIVLALLQCPVVCDFPSLAELRSAVRIRRNIVQAARKTTLAFHTSQAERPEDCWTYKPEIGFVIRPGISLIEALTKATQPEVSGALYDFSCYRATEYVMLLGIAQELQATNPALLAQLQALWTQRPIMSGEFHEVFLREQGSMEAPLPAQYFVPGDRVWFRNPDEASAEASGFEGSWVMYLGDGLFTNFWKRDQPYTLTRKCVEIYHWRHGLYRDAQGDDRIDEVRIEPMIQATLDDPAELARVMAHMTRFREPRGVYTEAGGCIDTTREFARWICPGTCDLTLPAA